MRTLRPSAAELATLARAVLGAGQPLSFVARGQSMSPTIEDGDTITVNPLTGPAALGAIVLYLDGQDRAVVHRVVDQRADGLLLVRGDAGGDELVPGSRLLGEVAEIARPPGLLADIARASRHAIARLGLRLASLRAPNLPRRSLRSAVVWLQRTPVYPLLARPLAPVVGYRAARFPRDERALIELYRAEGLEALVDDPMAAASTGTAIIATVGSGPIVGAAMMRPPSERHPDWWLFNMVVRLLYRRLGIAEELTRRLLVAAAEQGAARVHLIVHVANTAARRLYQRAGFQDDRSLELSRVLPPTARLMSREL